MAWPKGRPRSVADKQAISKGLRVGPAPHNLCALCGEECPKPGARWCSVECCYNDPEYLEEISEKTRSYYESNKSITGAINPYGRGGLPSPRMLDFAFLCNAGYEMDTVTIPIPTGSAYKLDFAHREAKVNIEIDGAGHRSRKHQDTRRDSYLRSLGWKVIRIKVWT